MSTPRSVRRALPPAVWGIAQRAARHLRVLVAIAVLVLSSRPAIAGTFTLSWDPSPEPDIRGYLVFWGTSPGLETNSVNVGNQTFYQFTEPDPTQTYYFVVRAYNAMGLVSGDSVEVSSAPLNSPLRLTGLSADRPAPQPVNVQVTFTATATGGTPPYQYKWLVFDGTRSVIGQNWSTANTFTWQPSVPNPAYTVTVWVRNASTSADAPEAQGTLPFPITATGPVAPPSVVTGSATSITTTGATVTGTANPNGSATTGFFQFGPTTGYGSTTAQFSAGSGTVSVTVGGVITGLTCNTLYHFRAVATNAGGTVTGADATFTTAACRPPTVVTGTATSIGSTSATLTGTVNPNGNDAIGYFLYGPTTSYGSRTLAATLGSGTVSVPIGNGAVTGLACNTLYHFRAVASNGGTTVTGADATFTTGACAPGGGIHRQDTSASASGAAVTLRFPGPVTAGARLVVALRNYSPDVVFSVRDTLGNVWTTIAERRSGDLRAVLWSAFSTAGGAETITITANQPTNFQAYAAEFAGVAGPALASESSVGTNTSLLDSGPGLTAGANVLLVGFGAIGFTEVNFTPGSGYTLTSPSLMRAMLEWRVAPAPGVFDATMRTSATAPAWVMVLAAFQLP